MRSIIFTILFIIISIKTYGQLQIELDRILAEHNFAIFKNYVDTLSNKKRNIETYWVRLRDLTYQYKEGTFYIEVPKAGTNDYYKDPTHVRPFVPETFKYFSDYAREYVAIGCKPWKITGMREEPSRLFVTMIKD